MSVREIRVVLDKDQAISDEWKRTAGDDFVNQLLIHWHGVGGLHILGRSVKLSREIKLRLDKAQFNDTIDRVIVQTAAQTTDRLIVSEDSDFWDPKNKDAKGKSDAPVARILMECEAIQVRTLGDLMNDVHPRAHRQLRARTGPG